MKMEQSMDEAERGPFDLCPPMAAAAMQPLAPLAGRDAGGAAAGSSQAAPRVEGAYACTSGAASAAGGA